MTLKDIIAQGFGIIGFIVFVSSFQCKDNKKLVFIQGMGGLAFFLNFILIGAYGGALFNLIILIRGLLFKGNAKLYKLLIVEILFAGAFVFSGYQAQWEIKQLILTALPCIALLVISYLMWKEKDKGLRYFQIFALSPAWLIHNVFNFTLGGIVCEIMNVVSTIISLVRYRKNK